MIIPVTSIPFQKSQLNYVIKKQGLVWILILLFIPIISLFTLYLFSTYTEYSYNLLTLGLILIQVTYGTYLIVELNKTGVIVNKSKIKNLKSEDKIYFHEVADKSQIRKIYFAILLYLATVISLFIF